MVFMKSLLSLSLSLKQVQKPTPCLEVVGSNVTGQRVDSVGDDHVREVDCQLASISIRGS